MPDIGSVGRIRWARVLARFVLGLAALAIGCGRSRPPAEPQAASSALRVEPVASPAGADSAEPQMTVRGDRVILSWFEVNGPHASLKFAERTPAGWSNPQTVVTGDHLFVNVSDVGSVRALADGTLAAHWMETNGPNPDATNVRLAWSKDQGKTWSKPVSPHHDGTKTGHGFATLFQSPGAGLGLLWIDGRATNPETEEGDTTLRAAVYDGAGKQLSEVVVDPRVCECCSTSVAETSEGLLVAYRGRTKDEIRDIHVSRLGTGGWGAPVVVHDDGWKIDACPINGPSVAAKGRDVAVAWFTAKDDQGRAFVAFSHDAGDTFGPPVRVDDAASLGRLGLQLLDDGSAAVIWIEIANQQSQFRVRTITPGGMRSNAVTIAEAEGSRYPRIARDKDELVFAWTKTGEGGPHVQTARANLSRK